MSEAEKTTFLGLAIIFALLSFWGILVYRRRVFDALDLNEVAKQFRDKGFTSDEYELTYSVVRRREKKAVLVYYDLDKSEKFSIRLYKRYEDFIIGPSSVATFGKVFAVRMLSTGKELYAKTGRRSPMVVEFVGPAGEHIRAEEQQDLATFQIFANANTYLFRPGVVSKSNMEIAFPAHCLGTLTSRKSYEAFSKQLPLELIAILTALNRFEQIDSPTQFS